MHHAKEAKSDIKTATNQQSVDAQYTKGWVRGIIGFYTLKFSNFYNYNTLKNHGELTLLHVPIQTQTHNYRFHILMKIYKDYRLIK